MSDDEDDDRDHRGRRRPDLDPEALEDLRFRAETERMGNRSRKTESVLGSWPPVFVAQWKCRHPKCATLVDVTSAAVDALTVSNDRLRSQGEREIPTDAIVLCDEHKQLAESYRVEALKKRHQVTRDAIVALKASTNPRAEHELISQLKATHHPDIEGLLQALEQKLASGGKRKGRSL